MYEVHDWAEVHRLYHREHRSKSAIAKRLGMSRPTVIRLLQLAEPPRYRRGAVGSKLDPHKDAIARMLQDDPRVPATVILEHLRRQGYAGGVTIPKEHLAKIRPVFLQARSYQRTTYLPGELAHGDWWELPISIPVGSGRDRKVHAWVMTLPHSAAHAAVFSFSRRMADLLPGVLGCLVRLGGAPEAMVVDNDPSIVPPGVGRTARAHPEVAALCGHLGMGLIVLEPGRPGSKGQGERTIGCLERSFLPLRAFADLQDLQGQHDAWLVEVALCRYHRRVGARVGDALAAERRWLHALPDRLPDVDRRTEARVQRDGFVRVDGVDYPGDVVIDPRHARALRLARQARARLAAGDLELEVPDLTRYDALAEADPAGVA